MQLTHRQLIRKTDKNYKFIDEACFKAKNIYNTALYIIRQLFCHQDAGNHTVKGYYINNIELEKRLRYINKFNAYTLSFNSVQQVFKVLNKNFLSFFALVKLWNEVKHLPDDIRPLKGKPNIPKYLDKKGRFQLNYTTNQFKIKGNYIHFPKKEGI